MKGTPTQRPAHRQAEHPDGPCGAEAGSRIERAAADAGYREAAFAAMLREYHVAAPEAIPARQFTRLYALASDRVQARVWNAAASASDAQAQKLYDEVFGPVELVRGPHGRSVPNPVAASRRRAGDRAYQTGFAVGQGEIAALMAFREGEDEGRRIEAEARRLARSARFANPMQRL